MFSLMYVLTNLQIAVLHNQKIERCGQLDIFQAKMPVREIETLLFIDI